MTKFRKGQSQKKKVKHSVNYLKTWTFPWKKVNLCVCGNETKSRVLRLSSDGTYEIFCKDCRELGEQE